MFEIIYMYNSPRWCLLEIKVKIYLNDEFYGKGLFREFKWLPYQTEWQICEINRETYILNIYGFPFFWDALYNYGILTQALCEEKWVW